MHRIQVSSLQDLTGHLALVFATSERHALHTVNSRKPYSQLSKVLQSTRQSLTRQKLKTYIVAGPQSNASNPLALKMSSFTPINGPASFTPINGPAADTTTRSLRARDDKQIHPYGHAKTIDQKQRHGNSPPAKPSKAVPPPQASTAKVSKSNRKAAAAVKPKKKPMPYLEFLPLAQTRTVGDLATLLELSEPAVRSKIWNMCTSFAKRDNRIGHDVKDELDRVRVANGVADQAVVDRSVKTRGTLAAKKAAKQETASNDASSDVEMLEDVLEDGEIDENEFEDGEIDENGLEDEEIDEDELEDGEIVGAEELMDEQFAAEDGAAIAAMKKWNGFAGGTGPAKSRAGPSEELDPLANSNLTVDEKAEMLAAAEILISMSRGGQQAARPVGPVSGEETESEHEEFDGEDTMMD